MKALWKNTRVAPVCYVFLTEYAIARQPTLVWVLILTGKPCAARVSRTFRFFVLKQDGFLCLCCTGPNEFLSHMVQRIHRTSVSEVEYTSASPPSSSDPHSPLNLDKYSQKTFSQPTLASPRIQFVCCNHPSLPPSLCNLKSTLPPSDSDDVTMFLRQNLHDQKYINLENDHSVYYMIIRSIVSL